MHIAKNFLLDAGAFDPGTKVRVGVAFELRAACFCKGLLMDPAPLTLAQRCDSVGSLTGCVQKAAAGGSCRLHSRFSMVVVLKSPPAHNTCACHGKRAARRGKLAAAHGVC